MLNDLNLGEVNDEVSGATRFDADVDFADFGFESW